MNQTGYSSLVRALALSLVLHALLLASGSRLASLLPPLARPVAPELRVRLVEPLSLPEPVPALQPQLLMREDTPGAAPPARSKRTPQDLVHASRPAAGPVDVRLLAGDAARKASEQITRELFYPVEAIERGLEGEALVLLFLDESGNAIAARIEGSSGHAILDEAAVRATRTLRSLPGSAPREALVPVRFRLR